MTAMDYRRLFADVHRRPDSYVMSGSFRESVAFINGCDAGNSWGLLIGFPEWLASKLGCEANLAWPALIANLAGTPPRSLFSGETPEADEARAVEVLFAEVDAFLAARNGPHGARIIISDYLKAHA
ncbi:hypothetical protein ACQEVX_30980 [Streptomyces syringium]|uniref:hypothetical protein n=1 Tax=Streptomyces syringium TaxID=76729 RepID=UPI003D9061D4